MLSTEAQELRDEIMKSLPKTSTIVKIEQGVDSISVLIRATAGTRAALKGIEDAVTSAIERMRANERLKSNINVTAQAQY